VWANLPPGVPEDFIFSHIAKLDGSGPVDALRGTTLERWGHVRRILAAAWQGTPKSRRPAILSAKLPKLDHARRKRIARLATALNNEVRT
jgi:hypothetical protein